MDDLISRTAALDALRYAELGCELEAIAELPSVQQWIPCSEHLPKIREWVLCQCRAGIMDVLRLTEDNGWYKDSTHTYMHSFVLAWCPLPEAWKGDKE